MNLHDKTQLKMTESDNDNMRRLIIRSVDPNYIRTNIRNQINQYENRFSFFESI